MKRFEYPCRVSAIVAYSALLLWAIVALYGSSAGTSSTRAVLISCFAWVAVTMVICSCALSLLRTERWTDYVVVPVVCVCVALGTHYGVRLLFGFHAGSNLDGAPDVFTLNVIAKLRDSFVSGTFFVPFAHASISHDYKFRLAIPCFLVSMVYFAFAAFLP